jgi:hypothetical protein
VGDSGPSALAVHIMTNTAVTGAAIETDGGRHNVDV